MKIDPRAGYPAIASDPALIEAEAQAVANQAFASAVPANTNPELQETK